MLKSSQHSSSSSSSSSSGWTTILAVGLLLTIVLSGGGFVFVAQQMQQMGEYQTTIAGQASHTEQKVSILENQIHKFRADFRKTIDKLDGTVDMADDLENIMKRLDQVCV